MPLIDVLPNKSIKAYEQPPIFSAQERKHFLTMPTSIKDKVNSFSTVTTKVGFQLMFAYFLARKRFFPTALFREKDIQFLCKRLGVLPFAFHHKSYKESTYTRHRKIILTYTAFKTYQPQLYNEHLTEAIETQIYSWEDNERIFQFMLEWLEWRHIELPTYHNLQTIITLAIRQRNQKIRHKFNLLLGQEHRATLDKLMEKQTNSGRKEYVITTLKTLSTSDTPKQIRANMEKFQLIQTSFDAIHLLMKQMNFSDNAIHYFGELVTATLAANLNRRVDKYLLLATFCIYQRYIFEDWMTLTFLNVCKSAINKAKKKEKERLFENRKPQQRAFVQMMNMTLDSQQMIRIIASLAWDTQMNSLEMRQQVQQLLPQQFNDPKQEQLEQIKEEFQVSDKDNYYTYLAEQSQSLQQRASPILKKLTFNSLNSNKSLLAAILFFQNKKGVITKTAPSDFLSPEDRNALLNEQNKFQVSLYKILLFQYTTDAIKRGSLNLKYSFKYKAMDDYLIPKHLWDKDLDGFLQKANLSHLKDFKNRIKDFKKMIPVHFKRTNDNILNKNNEYFRQRKNGKYYVVTPKVEKQEIDTSIFPSEASIPLSEILSTIDEVTDFLEEFKHLQPVYRKKRPHNSVFFAGITAFGCNLGIPAMAKAAAQLPAKQLENTANWYFSLDNINRANDAITNFTDKLPLANLYRKKQHELRTSSDGQKIKTISENTIFASYSTKYFNKAKGVVSYGFVDERDIPFYSELIDPHLREAPFVIDGLLHNEVIKSTIHVTDTHGYTEVIFGLMDLLGFGFSPNIAKMLDQKIYTFKENPIPAYKKQGYLVLPKGYFKEDFMDKNWNEMLRLVTSLKLKYCKASQIFYRFNSYSKQHPLYAALKEYGRLPKTIHILRSTDDVKMRQDGRKSSNAIEASNRFSSAVFFANGGEMIFFTRKEQQIADACKTLIKNTVICWNYLYLTRKIQHTKDPKKAEELIKLIKGKSVNAWRHTYFAGTYDFSEGKLTDSFNLLSSNDYDLGFG